MTTDQRGYDPAEDPDADPDQLNPRVGAAAGASDDDASGSPATGDEPDQDSDPASLSPRTDGRSRPER